MSGAKEFEIKGLSSQNVWDYENAFYWFSDPARINKLLSHFELYKQIIGLPGEVLEFGVYKAASIVRLATFRNLLENDLSRKIIGFDAFGKFPVANLTLESDFEFIERFEEDGGNGISITEANEIIAKKGFRNVSFVAGNIFDSLPNYLNSNPATRIAFLHLDLDVKEPTEFVLESLYDRVVPNGIIVFDDYGTVVGETDAVDQFLSKKKLKIEKSSHYKIPAFARKPS